MLSLKHRFHGRGSLRAAYERGENVRGQQLSLRHKQRDSKKPYRVAVVVSRKVSKSAVKRNRIRRRVYEQVRLNRKMIPPGTDLIFTAYSEQLANIDADRLRSTVQALLEKAQPTSRV